MQEKDKNPFKSKNPVIQSYTHLIQAAQVHDSKFLFSTKVKKRSEPLTVGGIDNGRGSLRKVNISFDTSEQSQCNFNQFTIPRWTLNVIYF